ncbi:hypothetical protein GCM10009867_32390 [Pedococcus aerophilus]|uniref:ANTAR domain-containing protein n=1 Tax=Pedococcus aerophilus TaxID=436356 RepID=A0ABN3UUU3_9MICO
MSAAGQKTPKSVEERVDDLAATVAQDHGDIEKLQYQADEATQRADARDVREDLQGGRLDSLETHVDVDRAMIMELQEDGLLSTKHAAELEVALRTSRKIGVAIGIVMSHLQVGEEEAFAFLSSPARTRTASCVTWQRSWSSRAMSACCRP